MSLWDSIKALIGLSEEQKRKRQTKAQSDRAREWHDFSAEKYERRTPGTPRQELITERAQELAQEKLSTRELEEIFFNSSMPLDARQEALNQWADITGWWRPDNADAWSSEQWHAWQEVYQSEDELW